MTTGLFSAESGQPVPLEGVRIDVAVSGLCSEVTIAQRYKNVGDKPIEAVYCFPLEEGSAVCGLTAKIGDRVVEGRVEEREAAFEAYDDAMAEGHGAFLLDQERPNVFTMSVGNLEPEASVELEIRYVAMLHLEGDAVRLMIPTTVSPRYVPASEPNEVGQPDGERVNPPVASSVPYGLQLSVTVDTPRIASIESPSHTVRTSFSDDGATVELTSERAALDRDFVLMIQRRDNNEPLARVSKDDAGHRYAMVTFTPSADDVEESVKEVIFVIDCSGSMGGDSIQQAKRALQLCVRALGEGDRFNIVRFGSRFDTLWNEPKLFTEATLKEANDYCERTDANMGGTEILSPLQAVLESPPGEWRREVLLLTDGEVSNEHAVIDLAARHKGKARIFSFGIGAGASEFLVRGVARSSGGAAEFIYPGERIEAKVLRMFGRLSTPALDDIVVDWGKAAVEQAPRSVEAVFLGEALTVFGKLTSGATDEVTLRAGDRSWSVPVDLELASSGGPIPPLWGRQAIRDLEEGAGKQRRGSNQRRASKEDRTRDKIVEIAKAHGLMSSHTSYVAVELRAEKDKTTEQAVLAKVPVALTAGWGGQGSVLQGHVGGAKGGGGRARKKSKMIPPPMASPAAPPPPGGMPMAPPAPAPTPARAQARVQALSLDEGGAPPRSRGASSGGLLDKVASFFGGDGGKKRDMAPADNFAPMQILESKAEMPQEAASMALADLGADDEAGGDVLYDVLLAQNADGSFDLTTQLRGFCHTAELDAAVSSHGPRVVATAVVLALLESRYGDRRAEWSAAARKAEKFLGSKADGFDAAALLQ